jgi:Xaa-Pro aminopeptidase
MDYPEIKYLIIGNKTPKQPSMSFSNEPSIFHKNEFSVKLEDCCYSIGIRY